MARPREHDGVVYRRPNTRILWMCYFDQSGKRIRESTFTEDWQEANKKLRERLGALVAPVCVSNNKLAPIQKVFVTFAVFRSSKVLKGSYSCYPLVSPPFLLLPSHISSRQKSSMFSSCQYLHNPRLRLGLGAGAAMRTLESSDARNSALFLVKPCFRYWSLSPQIEKAPQKEPRMHCLEMCLAFLTCVLKSLQNSVESNNKANRKHSYGWCTYKAEYKLPKAHINCVPLHAATSCAGMICKLPKLEPSRCHQSSPSDRQGGWFWISSRNLRR